MNEIAYKLPEWAFDEVIEMIERIETKAENLKKMCKKRSHFHVCEIRAHAFDFCDMAKNIREYLEDQIADQVQYTLSDEAIRMLEEAEANNDFVYVTPNEDGTYTIFDPSAWTGKADEEE